MFIVLCQVAKQAIIAYQTGAASVGNHTSSSSSTSTSNNRVKKEKEKEKEKSATGSLDEVSLSNAVGQSTITHQLYSIHPYIHAYIMYLLYGPVSGSLLFDGFVEDGSSVGGSSEHGQAIESVRSSDSSQHVSELFSALSPLSMSTSNRIMVSKKKKIFYLRYKCFSYNISYILLG